MDEEISNNILCGLGAVIIANVIKKRRSQAQKLNRRLWSRDWLLKRNSGCDIAHLVLMELQIEDVNSFQNFTRMSKATFNKLHIKVAPIISKENTVLRESIDSSARLLLTLRFLATGESYRSLSYSFRISVPAICIMVPETLQAIYEVLKHEYLKMPQCKSEWKEVAKEFEKQWNFPFCLGALDGKHIEFRAQKKDGSLYFNYKGFNSIILLALVDANYNFMYIDVGCNGRVNDAGVFNNSSLCTGIERNLFDFPNDESFPGTDDKVPYVMVADDAFRLTARILKPSGLRSSLEEKIYNYRLSRARRVVENAFGILANKFQVLQKEINLSVEKVELITLTACVLHNYVRKEDAIKCMRALDQENVNEVTITPGNWRSDVVLTKLQKPGGNRSGVEGIRVRNEYIKYFNTAGSVHWQWEAVKKFNF